MTKPKKWDGRAYDGPNGERAVRLRPRVLDLDNRQEMTFRSSWACDAWLKTHGYRLVGVERDDWR